jgi:hypothetical protein
VPFSSLPSRLPGTFDSSAFAVGQSCDGRTASDCIRLQSSMKRIIPYSVLQGALVNSKQPTMTPFFLLVYRAERRREKEEEKCVAKQSSDYLLVERSEAKRTL